jgi:hypothetical protein
MLLVSACTTASKNPEEGFVQLFDGKSLNGWVLKGKKGEGFGVKDGVIYCARGGGGNLLTEKEYADFILRFDFKVEPQGNNGLAIRTPLEGNPAYLGMELQILDENTTKYGKLRPEQMHGSVYDVIPAKTGALKPAGEWNSQEVQCIGRKVRVTVNNQVILDADLNSVTNLETLAKHPGLLKERGHLGFMGHDDYVEFKNIRIKDLSRPAQVGSPLHRSNVAPEGFTSLFNGRDLTGWKGLVADPVKRAKMSPAELNAAQTKADALAQQNWKVESGSLVYRGKGFDNLVTTRDYRNFELLADWKIETKGDSGIYLRGSPQVQIWDDPIGSGGLFNNEKNPSKPTSREDRFVGEWNRFRILLAGDKVTVFLNDKLVVNGVTMENFWDRTKPLYPFGPIELQAHETPVYFRNIYVREIGPKQ